MATTLADAWLAEQLAKPHHPNTQARLTNFMPRPRPIEECRCVKCHRQATRRLDVEILFPSKGWPGAELTVSRPFCDECEPMKTEVK
jgi:hypothetical protein